MSWNGYGLSYITALIQHPHSLQMCYELSGCLFGRASECEGHFHCASAYSAPVPTRSISRTQLLRLRETFEEPGRHSGQSVTVMVPAPPHCGQRTGANRRLCTYIDWWFLAIV